MIKFYVDERIEKYTDCRLLQILKTNKPMFGKLFQTLDTAVFEPRITIIDDISNT